jgi:hypothetical protein
MQGPASSLFLTTAARLPRRSEEVRMKGDRVEVVIDAGGSTRTYDIQATRAGRRVEVTHGRGIVEVTESTRGGTPVRTARFMAGRVLALVEHPAPRPALEDDAVAPLSRSA